MIDTVPRLVELEITRACQLSCTHCLTDSHPGAGHGSMTFEDWKDAIRQAADAGAQTFQLIGGEPTVMPHWRRLVEHILDTYPAATVQVYTNLYAVAERHWAIYEQPRVSLATSYYSDDPERHDKVTGKPGSHARTRGNIVEALRRGIPLQVGIVEINEGQRVHEARAELISLGVPEHQIKIDRQRGVGRANPNSGGDAPASELCGKCGDGRIAILPDGTVAPCVLGRALRGGNLLEQGTTLAGILAGPEWKTHMDQIPRGSHGCTPGDSDDCDPARTPACNPAYGVTLPYPTIRLRGQSE